MFPEFWGAHAPSLPPSPTPMFYSVSVYCVFSPWYGKHLGTLMYFVQSFSFSVSFISMAPVASKCPAPNRLHRVVPAPSWPCQIGIAELAAPSCPIPGFRPPVEYRS